MLRPICAVHNLWMDDLQILRPFQQFSVISGECAGGKEMQCSLAYGPGLEPGNAISVDQSYRGSFAE